MERPFWSCSNPYSIEWLIWNCQRLVPIPPFPLQELHQFEHYFSVPIQLLILLRQLTIRSIPFLVPIILSVHSALGFCYEPVSLNVPLTHYGISLERYLLCHTYDAFTPIAFLQCNLLDPYFRNFVSPYSGHSNRSWFIDPRHISSTNCLQLAFLSFTC